MKRLLSFVPLLVLVACGDTIKLTKDVAEISGLTPSMLCSGHTVAGVTGTADCSGGGGDSVSITEGLYVLASRNDILTDSSTWSSDWGNPLFLADLVSGDINRSSSVLTLQSVYSNSDFINFFKARYSAIPNPVTDSDGRYSDNPEGLEKKHYLEAIFANDPNGSRPHVECGTDPNHSTAEKIEDCGLPSKNGAKAYYNGRQYGQEGEGDWRLVTRLSTGEEVWRDERTKLLWSDSAASTYNWYRAAGYAKLATPSQDETGYISEPNTGNNCNDSSGNNEHCQPIDPISVCAEVDDNGFVVAVGNNPDLAPHDGDYRPSSDASIEKAFKGNLNASQGVLWKLPSISDWKLADVNGIRKVLPNMDYGFWSSSSYSGNRSYAWVFGGDVGYVYDGDRRNGGGNSVRCVALSRD